MSSSPSDIECLTRWRLALGTAADEHGISIGKGDDRGLRVERTLDFLYRQGPGDKTGQHPKNRSGEKTNPPPGETSVGLSIPDWVEAVRELFPKQAKEVLERELIHRKGIAKLLDQPDLLERVEPNVELVKTLLTHKGMLTPKTRVLARKVIDRVISQLKALLEIQIQDAIIGALRKDRHSPRKVFRNLDLKTTLRRNLRNWNEERQKLLVDKVYFYAAEKNKRPWHIVVCVDQSGSMMESTIFSAVMASIFAELPALRTSLVLYDTRVVDLSNQLGSPVDVLLNVQLGGGNDTPLALRHCQSLIKEPSRTILVLLSDFFEGQGEEDMIRMLGDMVLSGVRCIGLAALGYEARPQYNKPCVNRLRKVGMDVLACTPEKLAECMAQIIRGKPGRLRAE